MSEAAHNLYEVPQPSRCGACDALAMSEEIGTYKALPRPQSLRFSTALVPRESLRPRPWETQPGSE